MEQRARTEARSILEPDHPTAVVYLDETGVVHRSDDRYFGIACLKASDDGALLHGIRELRDRFAYHGEVHWADLDTARARGPVDLEAFALAAVDLFFESDDAYLGCLVADRQRGDLTAKYAHHAHPAHKAYADLAGRAVSDVIDGDEIVCVLADRLSAPRGARFEVDVRKQVNAAHGRLAVATVSRVDSRASDGVQMVDLLLGAVAFDLRRGRVGTETQKARVSSHMLDRAGVASFRPSGRELAGKYKVELLTRTRSRRGRRGGAR